MPIPLTTTTQLLESLRLNDGGDDAWALLLDRYGPVLHGIGRRLGLGDADAEDAAQQTLLELVRGLRNQQFDPARGGLRQWTLAILRNRIRDIQRLRAGKPAIGSVDNLDAQSRALDASLGVDLDEVWHDEVRRRVLAVALARLRSESRIAEPTLRAFELTALRSVPVAAVAQECGMSCDEVYVARNRVLTRLRRIIAVVQSAMEEA